MKITNLASGSKGNATLIESQTKNILIDIGLPLSNLEKRLGRPFPKIDILIITHTHTDHIKGIKTILKKQHPVVYTIENDLKEIISDKNINYIKEFEEDNLIIELFELSHDVPCTGVYLKIDNKEIVYMTDTGYIKDKIIRKYSNKNVYIIESNYEEELLRNGPYPYHLKQRIRSDRGHISNEDACKYLKKLIGDKTKHVLLAHLSEENNTPQVVEERITNLLEKIDYKPKITILNQEEIKQIEV